MDKFIPDMYQSSIYKINYKKLKKKGIKCLIFDLNNTIASYDTESPSKNLKELFHELEENFKVIIMSNNSKSRVRPFKEILNVDSSFKSHKPLKKKYLKIMDLYNFDVTEIACIGDMLLTDIYGANRMGITSILVNPISPEEPMNVRMLRKVEKIIIKRLNKFGILLKGSYYE